MRKSIIAVIIAVSSVASIANAADQWSAIYGDVNNAFHDNGVNVVRAQEILSRRAGLNLTVAQVQDLAAKMANSSVTQYDTLQNIATRYPSHVTETAPALKHVETIVRVEQYPSTQGATEIVTGAPESHKATLVQTVNTTAPTITNAAQDGVTQTAIDNTTVIETRANKSSVTAASVEATQAIETGATVIETRQNKSSIVKGDTDVINPQTIESHTTTIAKEPAKPAMTVVKVTETINGKDGKDGVNGHNGKKGVAGKDGVTTTIVKVDTATQQRVNNNTNDIAANRGEIISHSRAINRNSAAIERNSKAIEKNASDIAANRKAIKQVGAMAQAAANLHYNTNHNGYAVSVGEYQGSTAFAGGVQFKTGNSTAITIQASYDGESVGASVGIHGDF